MDSENDKAVEVVREASDAEPKGGVLAEAPPVPTKKQSLSDIFTIVRQSIQGCVTRWLTASLRPASPSFRTDTRTTS